MAERYATLLHRLIDEENLTMAEAAKQFERTARKAGIDATMSPRHLGRIARRENGGTPTANTRRVLSLMFNHPVDALLSPPPEGHLVQHSGTLAGLRGEVEMAADRARAFSERARSQLSEHALEQIYDEVRTLATDYPQVPVLHLVPNLIRVQGELMELIETPRPNPSHLRTLYFLTSVTSGLVAKSSHDLGRPIAAMTQARTAMLCAEQADHYGLRAWISGLQSMFAYWAGRPRDAVRYAQRGSDYASRTGSSAAVWLNVSESRAWAALGRADETRAAIARSESAMEAVRPDDLDELGGLCQFTRSRQLYYAADALAWLPSEAGEAERYGQAAVDAYATHGDDWAFSDEAGAMSDLAIARVRRGEIAGATAAIAPVLELAPDQRINGIVSSVGRVHDAVVASGIDSDEAGELQDRIEDFQQAALPAVADQ